MAVVGEAHIIVRALTDKVSSDIQKGFSGVGASGKKAGETMAQSFTRGFQKNANASVFTKFADGVRTMVPGADAARKSLQMMFAAGNTLTVAIGQIIGGVFSLIGALGALGGSALGAGASVAALGPIFVGVGLAMLSARLALSGVGKALAALNKQSGGGANTAAQAIADAQAREAAAKRVEDAERNLAEVIQDNRQNLIDANNSVRDSQLELNKAIKQGQEEIQQLGFDAEEAALSESKAALELDKARETLARTQDLPPNSRARKEAELAFQEAELRLRQAKDKSADLNKEQNRLAKSGVAGTNAVISANQRLAQAEAAKAKAIQDALRKQADAERGLADAKKAQADAQAKADAGGGGGPDPFAGLTASQAEFVRNLQSLKPLLTELKTAISDAFLPPLWTAISTLVSGLFPTIKTGMTQVATALGVAVNGFADMAVEQKNVLGLAQLFTGASGIIAKLGTTAGAAYGIAISLLNAATPMANTFVNFLNTRLLSFDSYLKSDAGAAAVKNFFALSESAAAQFGTIIDNVLGGIGGIIMANLGPGTGGQYMLDFFKDATAKFAALDDTAAGKSALKDYFLAVSQNAGSVLGALGALIKELGALGANPAIGATFDILKAGAPALGELLRKAVEAGPVLAELVVSIINIANKMQDTGAMEVFFGTLLSVANAINRVLDNDVVMAILNVTGKIFAFGAAFMILGSIGSFAFKAIAGSVAGFAGSIGSVMDVMKGFKNNGLIGGLDAIKDKFSGTGSEKDRFIDNLVKLDGQVDTSSAKTGTMTGALDKVKGAFATAGAGLKSFGGMVATGFTAAIGSIGGMFGKLGGSLATFGRLLGGFMLSPAGIVIGIIALIVGGLILLYNTSEEFRTGMDAIFSQLGAAFADAGAQIMAAIQPLIPMLLGAMQQIMAALAPLIPLILQAFLQIMQAIMPLIPILINALIPAIMAIITAIVPLITMLMTSLVPVILQVIQAFVPLITTIISMVVPVILMLIQAFVPLITLLIDTLVPIIVMIIEMWAALIPPILTVVTTIISILIPVFQFLIEVIVAVVVGIINSIVGFVTFIIEAFTNISNFITTVWTAIAQFFSDVWNNIVSFVTTAWNALVAFLQPAIDAFFGFWNAVWTSIGTFISDTWNNIVSFVTTAWNALIGFLQPAIDAFVAFWTNIWNGIVAFFKFIWDAIVFAVKFYFTAVWNTIKFIIDAISAVWNAVWNGIVAFFKFIWESIVNAVTFYFNLVKGIIDTVIKVISTIWTNVWNGISTFFSNLWNGIVSFITGAVNNVRNIISNVINGISTIWKNVWNGISSFFSGIWNGIINAVNTIGGVFRNAFSGIANFVSGIFSSVVGAIKGAINGMIGIVNGAIRALNNIKVKIPSWVPFVGGQQFGVSLPTIPYLAEGGVVSPTNGGTLAKIAEAGRPERVEPLDANGLSKRDKYMLDLIKAQSGGSINIVVNPSAGMDESELASAISREISFQMRRGAVA